MKYNAEQVAFMLHEAIDLDREYKSWHVSTKHLMTLVEMVVAEEREACAEVCDGLADIHAKMNQWGSQKTADTLAQAIRARGEA